MMDETIAMVNFKFASANNGLTQTSMSRKGRQIDLIPVPPPLSEPAKVSATIATMPSIAFIVANDMGKFQPSLRQARFLCPTQILTGSGSMG